MSFFDELKRRNVFRVAIGYVITAWLLLQVVDLVLENVNAPDWVMQVFMLALAIGFPLAIFFAWAFEMTPEGVKREADVDRTQSIATTTGRKMDRNIIIAMTLALAYFAYDKFFAQETNSPPPSAPSIATEIAEPTPAAVAASTGSDKKSVAVLPFINMSDDKENEYFSDGISEELLNVLVRVKGLRVPSRTSSFTFKGSTKNLAEIGKELQVDHILEGSVRKGNDRIRVTAQLIEVDTDTHLWSETYTRKLDDIFAVQDEIANAIVTALKITLTGEDDLSDKGSATSNVDAYNKYLLGRHLWNQRTPDSLVGASVALTEAVEIDPAYGMAWAALADAYALMPEYGAGTISDSIPLARNATEKALAINPDSSHALTTSAYVKFLYDYDFPGAHADFKKAIANDPDYATAYQWYGELLAVEGQTEAALEQLEIARRADPLSPVIPHVMGWVSMGADQPEVSQAYYSEVLEIDPYFPSTIYNLINVHIWMGQFDQARARSREHAALFGYDPTIQLAVINAVENPALTEQALALLDGVPDGTQGKAENLMLLNQPELALDSLEVAFAEGNPYAVHMKRIYDFQPLHDNPRFQALLAKMNMWP